MSCYGTEVSSYELFGAGGYSCSAKGYLVGTNSAWCNPKNYDGQ